ncbi:hypothetical protein KCP73_24200 [Salmonella enterica subsp. enterica]|nr:hypothetical protein KCP73_24200 [Salmonella enterica subsp. enterica]
MTLHPFDFEENICLTKEAADFFSSAGYSGRGGVRHVGTKTVYEEALAGITIPTRSGAEFVARESHRLLAAHRQMRCAT